MTNNIYTTTVELSNNPSKYPYKLQHMSYDTHKFFFKLFRKYLYENIFMEIVILVDGYEWSDKETELFLLVFIKKCWLSILVNIFYKLLSIVCYYMEN